MLNNLLIFELYLDVKCFVIFLLMLNFLVIFIFCFINVLKFLLLFILLFEIVRFFVLYGLNVKL